MVLHAILILYGIALALLSLVSLNRYVLISYCRKHRRRFRDEAQPLAESALPVVTIQLPIYNEYYVVERLIGSACELDYPRDRLEVQVLDDSTDETVERVRDLVAAWRARGIDVVHIHRTDRTGFKSGALANGLIHARGEFVAIFDADFIIPRDFLRRMMPHFQDPSVGIAQARWSYVNENYSLLTRATVIGLDAQFGIEQPGRYWGGLFLGFNGTAAVLRAQAIRDAGGWEHDTITEDLDLSYRAELAGWRIVYRPEVTCDSEVPVDVHGLKAQQFRWTKGTQETAKKLIPRVWNAPISPWLKVQGVLHLLANGAYPPLLLAGLLNPLVMYAAHAANIRIGWPISAYFLFSMFGTYSYHAEAVRLLHPDWPRRMWYFPVFIAQAIGLSVSNARAALEAWIGKRTAFIRTPKYDITDRHRAWQLLTYRSAVGPEVVVELLLGAYTFAGIAYAIVTREYGAIPFLLLFGCGYFLVGIYSLWHGVSARRTRARSLTESAGDALSPTSRAPFAFAMAESSEGAQPGASQ